MVDSSIGYLNRLGKQIIFETKEHTYVWDSWINS